jgi:hypothetical protein
MNSSFNRQDGFHPFSYRTRKPIITPFFLTVNNKTIIHMDASGILFFSEIYLKLYLKI